MKAAISIELDGTTFALDDSPLGAVFSGGIAVLAYIVLAFIMPIE